MPGFPQYATAPGRLRGASPRRGTFPATIALAAFLVPCLAAQSLPPAPPLDLASFPASGRSALEDASRRAAARPDDAGAAGALARLLHAWEQWEAAHAAYSRARALAPRAFEWTYLDAVVLQRLARHDEAVARLRHAVALDPDYLPARVRLAELLLDTGAFDEAGPLFDSLSREAAAEPASRVGLGRIAAAQGRHEEAVRQFERAVALFPELAAAHYGLARSYRALGRLEDAAHAAAAHARYGAQWPRLDDPVLSGLAALRDDARAHLQKGVALAGTGALEEAIAAHGAALERDAGLAQAHVNLVSLYGRTGAWDKAEEHYRRALSLGVDSADAHYDYGVVLGLQARWVAAADAYRRALAANPLHAQARNNLGQILERTGDFAGAAAEYRQALDAQPAFRLARFNLGRMLLALRQPERAIAEFEPLVTPEDAETPRYLFGLATAYVQSGRSSDGRRTAERARDLALHYGQADLAAAIERQLSLLN